MSELEIDLELFASILPLRAAGTVPVWAFSVGIPRGSFNLKTAVDFNAESQRCRVMQRKSEVLRGNGKYKNFSDRVNLHQLGVACMVLQK